MSAPSTVASPSSPSPSDPTSTVNVVASNVPASSPSSPPPPPSVSVYETLGKGKVIPDWIPDEKVTDCVSCGVKFGLLTRKHHCRLCGLIVCNVCSSFKARLQAYANDLVRICVECHCSISSAQRGVSIPKIRQFIRNSQSETNISKVQKTYAASKLTEIQKLIHVDEKKIYESPPTDQAEFDDMKGKMLKMAADAGRLQEDINKMRLQEGLVARVILSDKLNMGEPLISAHRLLIITPGPARLLGISSLIYPSMGNSKNAEREFHQVRFRILRGIDEIQTIKPIDYSLQKGQVGKGIQITWANLPPWESAPSSSSSPPSSSNPNSSGLPTSPSLVSNMNDKPSDNNNNNNSSKDKDGKGKNSPQVTQFLLVDTNEIDTLEKVENYMKKLETQRQKANKRGSITLRSEVYDAKLMETLKEMKENKGKEKEKSDPSSTSNSLDNSHSPFSLQSETLQTLHALVKEHLMGVKTQLKLLDSLVKDMKTEVMWSTSDHEELMKRLWFSWSGKKDGEFIGQKSDGWKSLGFQGTDPQTDFRGMGLMALKTLVWAGESYPKDLQLLVQNQSERDYPLATAGINLIAMIAEMLTLTRAEGYERPVNKIPLFRIFCRHADLSPLSSATTSSSAPSSQNPSYAGTPVNSLSPSFTKLNPFAELISNLLPLLDHLWVQSNANYFQFPQILSQIKERILAALVANPHSFRVFIKMIHQEDLQVEDAVDFMLPPQSGENSKVPGDVDDKTNDDDNDDVAIIDANNVDDMEWNDDEAQRKTVLTHRVTIAGGKTKSTIHDAKVYEDESED